MTTYTFSGPKVPAKRTGNCPTCGKKTTRSRGFEATVNPFNTKIVNGERVPKTWDDVLADLRAEASAWMPDPEVFEHESCRAARTAPQRAEPVGLPPERVERGLRLRAALDQVFALADGAGLPIDVLDISVGRDRTDVRIAFVPAGEIVAWAHALGATVVDIDDGGHCTYVRPSADLDGVRVTVSATIPPLSQHDALTASVDWRRDRDTGRKTGYGTVGVDALAEGLALLGIAVVEPWRDAA